MNKKIYFFFLITVISTNIFGSEGTKAFKEKIEESIKKIDATDTEKELMPGLAEYRIKNVTLNEIKKLLKKHRLENEDRQEIKRLLNIYIRITKQILTAKNNEKGLIALNEI